MQDALRVWHSHRPLHLQPKLVQPGAVTAPRRRRNISLPASTLFLAAAALAAPQQDTTLGGLQTTTAAAAVAEDDISLLFITHTPICIYRDAVAAVAAAAAAVHTPHMHYRWTEGEEESKRDRF